MTVTVTVAIVCGRLCTVSASANDTMPRSNLMGSATVGMAHPSTAATAMATPGKNQKLLRTESERAERLWSPRRVWSRPGG